MVKYLLTNVKLGVWSEWFNTKKIYVSALTRFHYVGY
jgi:hypothetical protein